MQPLPFPVAHPFVFFAIFAVAFYGSFAIASRLGGWAELGRVYPSTDDLSPIDARVWRGQGVRLRNGTHYNGAVTVAANHSGVYFAMPFLLRFCHPPLFIPWTDIHTHPAKSWGMDFVRFDLRGTPVWLMLRKKLADQVLAMRPGGVTPSS